MERKITLALAVLFVGIYATEAKAQKVSIKNIDDSKAGQLTITADVEGIPNGWTLIQVTMEARPPKGAAGKGGVEGADPLKGGGYGATIEDLKSGDTFDVQVVILVADPQFKGHRYFSSVQSKKVK